MNGFLLELVENGLKIERDFPGGWIIMRLCSEQLNSELEWRYMARFKTEVEAIAYAKGIIDERLSATL